MSIDLLILHWFQSVPFLLGCTEDDHCTDEGFICDTTLQVCNGKFNNVLSKQLNETKKTKTSNTSFESLKPLDFKYVISEIIEVSPWNSQLKHS